MGRQVNFYLSYQDQKELLLVLQSSLAVACFIPPEKSAIPVVRKITDCPEWQNGSWNPYFFRADTVPNMQWRFEKAWGGYLPDTMDYEAVDFDRCIMRNNKIAGGRFYYEATYLDDAGYITEKSPEFISFAKKLFAITKKFCPFREDWYYVGPDADRLRKSGVELVVGL